MTFYVKMKIPDPFINGQFDKKKNDIFINYTNIEGNCKVGVRFAQLAN